MSKVYVQYGCGLSSPEGWVNYDASPTLRLQKTPVFGKIIKPFLNTVFPSTVKYGDIVKGLAVDLNSCDGVYCSHVLEHLALSDFRIALKNTYEILKPGGVFRCVLPDLEFLVRSYINSLERNDPQASLNFIGNGTLLGIVNRPKGIKDMLVNHFGNSNHLWMWDFISLSAELQKAGFKEIRRVKFNDSNDEMFKKVEDETRFINALAIECLK
jgi:hypothetical protein